MDNATYVLFAAKEARASVREQLRNAVTDTVKWTERKSFSGSEFFISGPPTKAREAHETLRLWMAKTSFQPR